MSKGNEGYLYPKQSPCSICDWDCDCEETIMNENKNETSQPKEKKFKIEDSITLQYIEEELIKNKTNLKDFEAIEASILEIDFDSCKDFEKEIVELMNKKKKKLELAIQFLKSNYELLKKK